MDDYEAKGIIARANLSDTFRIDVGKTPSLVLSLNFDLANQLGLDIYDPDGIPVMPGDAGVIHRVDPTHEQFRVGSPDPGVWQAVIRAKTAGLDSTNYVLFGSAESEVQMHLIASPEVDDKSQLIVLLADNAPIKGASVNAQVMLPGGSILPLTLHDDGINGDGAANDGIYGVVLPAPDPGVYQIKAGATGIDSSSDNFMRFAQTLLFVCRDATYCTP